MFPETCPAGHGGRAFLRFSTSMGLGKEWGWGGGGAPHLHCSRQRPGQSTGCLPRESSAFRLGHPHQLAAHLLPVAGDGCRWAAGAETSRLGNGGNSQEVHPESSIHSIHRSCLGNRAEEPDMGTTPKAHGVEWRRNAETHDTAGEEVQAVAHAGSRRRRTRDGPEGARLLLHTSAPAHVVPLPGRAGPSNCQIRGRRPGRYPPYSSLRKRQSGRTITSHVGL